MSGLVVGKATYTAFHTGGNFGVETGNRKYSTVQRKNPSLQDTYRRTKYIQEDTYRRICPEENMYRRTHRWT